MFLLYFLSEKTKSTLTTIATLLIFLIVIFIIIGFIGNLIEKIMQIQGKKVDRYMTNVVLSRLCDNQKEFVRIAKLKNRICFFKATLGPLCLFATSLAIYLVYHLSIGGDWGQSIFDTKTGISSLFYVFDFSKAHYMPILAFPGIEVTNYPHFVEGLAILNYFIFLFALAGIIWYLVNVQAYFAKLYRIKKLKNQIYSKDLSTLDISHFYNINRINPQNVTETSTNQDNK